MFDGAPFEKVLSVVRQQHDEAAVSQSPLVEAAQQRTELFVEVCDLLVVQIDQVLDIPRVQAHPPPWLFELACDRIGIPIGDEAQATIGPDETNGVIRRGSIRVVWIDVVQVQKHRP